MTPPAARKTAARKPAALKPAARAPRKVPIKAVAVQAPPSLDGGPVLSIMATSKPTFQIDFIGKTYDIVAPKSALAMKMAVRAKTASEDPALMYDTLIEWVFAAFGTSQGASIVARLDDAEDDLDVEHITDLIEKVMEYQSNLPTS